MGDRRLYFMVGDGVIGRKLWSLPLGAATLGSSGAVRKQCCRPRAAIMPEAPGETHGSARAVTLRLPDPLYDQFQNRAERAHRSLEAELLDAVATVAAADEELSPDLAKALGDLELLTDAELWRAARNRLSEDARAQLEALNMKQQRELLTLAEKETLEQLVRQYDQAVLLRAEAARLLKERGHEVSKLLAVR